MALRVSLLPTAKKRSVLFRLIPVTGAGFTVMDWVTVLPLAVWVRVTVVSVMARVLPFAGEAVIPFVPKSAKATSSVLESDLVKVTTNPDKSRASPAV